jgi:CBS domain-containing protein
VSATTPPLDTLRVEDVMHAGLVTCPPHTTLRGVARILAAHRIHAVVVADDRGRDPKDVHGVVSDLDLLAAAVRSPLEEQTAGTAAATPAHVVPAGSTVEAAARAMVENRVAHLVVVDEESGRTVGVLSTLDVAEALS